MYESPISTLNVAASAAVKSSRGKVLGIDINPSGTAGSIELRDDGASGTVKVKIDTPALATAVKYIEFPGYVRFNTDIYVTLTDVTSVTVFFD